MPEGVLSSSGVVLSISLVIVLGSTFRLWKRPRKKKQSNSDTDGTQPEDNTSVFDVFGGERKVGEGTSFLEALFGQDLAEQNDSETEEIHRSRALVTDSEPAGTPQKVKTKDPSFFDLFVDFASSDTKNEDEGAESALLDKMIIGARKFAGGSGDSNQNMKTSESTESIDRFLSELNFVGEALKKNFSHLNVQDLHPLSVLYYLEKEDSVKTPSWKRRNHRFLPDIDKETVYGIHDALYLSELSYLDSKEEIQQGLKNFVGSASYQLVYCSVKGEPRRPAHYVAIQKESMTRKKAGFLWWGGKKVLEVIVVVRGTKEIGDVLSDCMLDTSPYRDGVSHEGVMQAGKFVAEQQRDLLKYLLKESGRDTLNITVIGHVRNQFFFCFLFQLVAYSPLLVLGSRLVLEQAPLLLSSSMKSLVFAQSASVLAVLRCSTKSSRRKPKILLQPLFPTAIVSREVSVTCC